jgi:hypothetical protein
VKYGEGERGTTDETGKCITSLPRLNILSQRRKSSSGTGAPFRVLASEQLRALRTKSDVWFKAKIMATPSPWVLPCLTPVG